MVTQSAQYQGSHLCVLLTFSSRDQIFNVKETVSFLSQGTTLTPGTIIMTGTPAGVGYVQNSAPLASFFY